MELESYNSVSESLDFESESLGLLPRANGNNYLDDEGQSDDASNHSLDLVNASQIKCEPTDYCEDDQYDNFNIRKRKNSFSSGDSSTGRGTNDQETGETKRKRKKFIYNYTQSQLQEALDSVHSENTSILTAAKQYGIPRSTLRRYALTVWAAAAPKTRTRQEPALTPPEEAHIVSMITKMSRAGKYVSTMDVKSTVQNLLDESHRIVFKDRNRPTCGWVQRFRKRHKDLPLKGSGYTVKKPGPFSVMDVNQWYNEINDYLLKEWEVSPSELFTEKNMHRIYNLDELTFPLNNKQDLVDVNISVGSKNDEAFSEVTVLTAVSAAGELLQPLIIQKGEGGGHDDDIMPLDQNSYGISFSIAGKLNHEILVRWLEAFDRELYEKDIPKPVILFLDDIFAHFHISVFTYAIDNDIILLCLQSPTYQPIFSEISEQVKNAYRLFCKEHYSLLAMSVSMDLFPELFLKAWETLKEEQTLKKRVVNSFCHFGLLPFNANALVYADLPETHEEPVRIPKSMKQHKEPKAKKTVACKPGEEDFASASLLPKVKIKKLERELQLNNYRIMDGCVDMPQLTQSLSSFCGKTKAPSKPKSKKISHLDSQMAISKLSQERLAGRQDGIRKCLDLMESFIPSDVVVVWKKRSDDIKNSSEIPYCMWRTVSNMLRDMGSLPDQNLP